MLIHHISCFEVWPEEKLILCQQYQVPEMVTTVPDHHLVTHLLEHQVRHKLKTTTTLNYYYSPSYNHQLQNTKQNLIHRQENYIFSSYTLLIF